MKLLHFIYLTASALLLAQIVYAQENEIICPSCSEGESLECVCIDDEEDEIDIVPKPKDISCKKTKAATDGNNGFLWKASDHGGLVVLFPQKFGNEFERVMIVAPRGDGKNQNLEDLYYTGKANGNRQHWRSNMELDDFPEMPVLVKAFRYGKVKPICWLVTNPRVRND